MQLETTGAAQGGGKNIGWIELSDYIAFNPISLAGIDSLTFRVASANAGGFIDVRLNGAEGAFLGRLAAVYRRRPTHLRSRGNPRAVFRLHAGSQ